MPEKAWIVPHASAAILLDFGLTTVTGTDRTNSPYHVATSSTDLFWNKVQTSDVALNGLTNSSDDSTASGLALNLGAGNGTDPTTIALTNQPDSSLALGSVTSAGIYGGTSVGTDGIFEGSGSEIRSIGFQLTGLAAGSYDIYLNTRNTNTSNAYSMTSFAAAGVAGANFDHSLYPSASVSYTGTATNQTTSWIQEGNYTKLSVTLTAGQALNVAVAGGGLQSRGFLNSAAIVAVPEPSGVMLACLGLVSLLAIRRRGR